MLGFVQIVALDFFLNFKILYQDKVPAKTKLMPAKLDAVLACTESDSRQC